LKVSTPPNNSLQPTAPSLRSVAAAEIGAVGHRSASGVKQTMPGNKIIDGGAHETVAEDI